MNRQEYAETIMNLEGVKIYLEAKLSMWRAEFQASGDPVADYLACAFAAALGTVERQIDNLPKPTAAEDEE